MLWLILADFHDLTCAAALAPLVGSAEHVCVLLPPLERLATVEEMAVRDAAVGSLGEVAKAMSSGSLQEHCLPMISRLSLRDWFTARISAAGLVPTVYPRVAEEHKESLKVMFSTLARDLTPMVRRAASAHFGQLAAVIEPTQLHSMMLPLAQQLARDDQDSIRLLAIDNCVALANAWHQANAPSSTQPSTAASNDALLHETLSVVQQLAADTSWRVRWSVASHASEAVTALGAALAAQAMAEPFAALCADKEPEVRTAAAGQVAAMAKHLGAESTVQYLMPGVKSLSEDSKDSVRAALAQGVMSTAHTLGQESTVQHLLPIFLTLLRDTESQVRLNIIGTLDDVNTVIGVALLRESLLPSIMDLSEDRQWRVRLAVIKFMPLLAAQLGQEVFDAELTSLVVRWLSDEVSSIRECAVGCLPLLVKEFGPAWITSAVKPALEKLQQAQSYMLRMVAVRAAAEVGLVAPPDSLGSDLLPLLCALASDKVPNVRFNAAKALHKLHNNVAGVTAESTVVPLLQTLLEDADADVRHFAQEALQAYGAEQSSGKHGEEHK